MKKIEYYSYKSNVFISRILFLLSALVLFSCKDFLDLKPDSSLYIASNLRDCQALLDDYSKMNTQYPIDGEAAADNYFLRDESWASLNDVESQETYIWAAQGQHVLSQWSRPYAVVFNSNLVLKILSDIDPSTNPEYNEVKGSALFFRGYAFYSVASLFCKPYDLMTSREDPGIPLHLNPEATGNLGRGTVQETYDRIIKDLVEAVELLPEISTIKSRPNKVAALATLARVYLSMRNYSKAGDYANLCLGKYNYLIDYNSLTTSAALPFKRFNDEVIFQAIMTVSNSALLQRNARVPESLYKSFASNDIRKLAFFKLNTQDSTYAFKGSYDGSTSPFSGLATDEIYLIRAECNARNGKTSEAMTDLNTLLRNRYLNKPPTHPYVDFTASNAQEALDIILNERRKELIFRGIRWADLRRLNKEPKYATTLTRTLNGQVYSLPPNDPRYTLLIPRDVINNSSVTQNSR